MRQFKWPRPRKGQGSRGITIIELVVSLSVMIIIILAGTELLQTTVKIEKDVIESMGSTSTEIIVTNRLYQDFKYSGMSYNFLLRFDDGGSKDTYYLTNENDVINGVPATKVENKSRTKCSNIEDIKKDKSLIAACDFYLYDPSCNGDQESSGCSRSVTLKPGDGKRDFVILSADTGVTNASGVRGGSEYLPPPDIFNLKKSSDDYKCKGVTYCNQFNHAVSLFSGSSGRWMLLSTTVKGTDPDSGYPDRYLSYPSTLGYISSSDESSSTLVKGEHLLDIKYASNYIVADKDGDNSLEINFHDENIFAAKEGDDYPHYFYKKDDKGNYKVSSPIDFLKITQAYNGEQVDYTARPIRIIRYHISDAYSRAKDENPNSTPSEKLRGVEPCLSRYVYYGDHWAGVSCQFEGVKSITFSRSVSDLGAHFSIEMESDAERKAHKNEKKKQAQAQN